MIFFFTQRVSGRKKCGFYLKFYVTIQVLDDLNCVYNVFSFGYFLRKNSSCRRTKVEQHSHVWRQKHKSTALSP